MKARGYRAPDRPRRPGGALACRASASSPPAAARNVCRARTSRISSAGRSLMHTIDAALGSGVFARVVVSTEDAEISDLAHRAGAETHERHYDLASDTATPRRRVHGLSRRRASGRAVRGISSAACSRPSPMRSADDVRRAARADRARHVRLRDGGNDVSAAAAAGAAYERERLHGADVSRPRQTAIAGDAGAFRRQRQHLYRARVRRFGASARSTAHACAVT